MGRESWGHRGVGGGGGPRVTGMSADRPEVQSVGELAGLIDRGAALAGRRLQGLDLTAVEGRLRSRTDLAGLVVLGGRVSPDLERHLRAHGALVFPADPRVPVDPYRSRLYIADELYAGLAERGYEGTPDARAYHWFLDRRTTHDVYATLLRAIHDDAMTDALDEWLDALPVAGVMGGHAVLRGSDEYAAAARLGHRLAEAGLVVATGGGPGAMEAANLGAAARDADALDRALVALGEVPGWDHDVGAWAGRALAVRDRLLSGTDGHGIPVRPRSVGIPTWFYGHEPSNVFADGIAKYFSNALREDGLLARCAAGIVVLPGAAGTVQEIFQTATRLYYSAEDAPVPPLVLVGRRQWTEQVPVWPALAALGRGTAMGRAVRLVDDVDEAAEVVLGAAQQGAEMPPQPRR